MLRTEPSFCIYNNEDQFEDEAGKEHLIQEKLMNSDGEKLETQFSFSRNNNSMIMIKEDDDDDEEEEDDKERVTNQLTDDLLRFENPSGDENVDAYNYIQMVNQYPHDPLVLRNYAQLLESKKDFSGAEEYYRLATVADPEDGLTLSRLAKLTWDQHRDRVKASTYFEKSARAAPDDSDVLGAYASFLWETADNDDDELEENNLPKPQISELEKENRPKSPPLHLAMGLGTTGLGRVNYTNVDSIDSSSIGEEESYYKRMVDENPCDPLCLKNYAQYLHQTKGDVQGAEEYYSRAILIDPTNGETLALYAHTVWQLYHDKDKALVYFQQAVQASPEDSDVLAAYAKFLWETEDE